MRRILIVLVVVLLVCGVFSLLASSTLTNVSSSAAQSAILSKTTIDKGNLELTVSATGSLVANLQSPLSFDQPGRVLEVLIEEGQRVEAGQVLARLDDAVQRENLRQAEAMCRAAQAVLDKLVAPVDARDVQKAEADVKTVQGQYSSIANSTSLNDIQAYRVQYQQALAAVSAAEQIRIEAGGRYGTNDPGYQKALAQLGEATFNAEVARLKLEQAEGGQSLLSATANIAYYQAILAQVKAGPSQPRIDDAQAQLAIAQVQRDQAQHRVDRMRLIAPFSGVVTSVRIKAGEMSSGVAVVLTDTSLLYADVRVDESDIVNIASDQPVTLTLDALPEVTLTGKVLQVAQSAEANTSVIMYIVRVALDPTTARIKAGMTANAVFQVQEIQDVVRVPNTYLKLDTVAGLATVNLLRADGSFVETPIKVGVQGTDYSEVIEGLSEGDTVALLNTAPSK